MLKLEVFLFVFLGYKRAKMKGLLSMKCRCLTKLKYLLVISLLLLFAPSNVKASNIVSEAGNHGEQVEQIQTMLFEVGMYTGIHDGTFGPQTEQAVKNFQISVRRSPTGTVDKYLYNLLIYKSKLDLSKVKGTLVMEATAYSAYDPGCTGRTSTGSKLKKGIIAVDPKVIPLGTQLYIVGYGRAIADDQGSAIKGNVIDVAFDSRAAALNFGRRTVKVYKL